VRKFILIWPLIFLVIFCEKQNTSVIESNNKYSDPNQASVITHDSENLQSMTVYRGTEDVFAPNGKVIRIYNSKTMETQWGPIFAPVIYLYDIEKKELAKYEILDIISENFWGGNIDVTYNNERNSFDMIFSLDAYGNYGTAYIDLNTNEFVRELATMPNDERNEQISQHQGIPDGYLEGTNLNKNIK
jgi:hypothetical protein